MKQIYTRKHEPMNVIAFASTSGTNVKALYDDSDGYRIRAVFCDKKCGAMDLAKSLNIPVIYESGYNFCGSFIDASKNGTLDEYVKRAEEYDKHVVDTLNFISQSYDYNIDLIVLAGYMRIVREPLLEAFPDKIINIHPGDLSESDKGERKYVGDDAVLKAIASGELYTHSTAHIVTGELDGGEILVLSRAFAVEPSNEIRDIIGITSKDISILDSMKSSQEYEMLKNFADEHQNKQKRYCDWPTLTLAVELIAKGDVAIGEVNESGLRDVYFNWVKLPYEGYRMLR